MGTFTVQVDDADHGEQYLVRVVDGLDKLAHSETLHNWDDAWDLANHLTTQTDRYKFEPTGTRDRNHPHSWHAMRVGRIVIASNYRYELRAHAEREMRLVQVSLPGARVVDLSRARR